MRALSARGEAGQPRSTAAHKPPNAILFYTPLSGAWRQLTSCFGGLGGFPTRETALEGAPNRLSILTIRCLVLGADRPHSRGELRLATSDPHDAPRIEPNYLADPRDVQAAVAGVRLMRSVARSPTLGALVTHEVSPGPTLTSDADLEAYVLFEGSDAFGLRALILSFCLRALVLSFEGFDAFNFEGFGVLFEVFDAFGLRALTFCLRASTFCLRAFNTFGLIFPRVFFLPLFASTQTPHVVFLAFVCCVCFHQTPHPAYGIDRLRCT